MEKKFEVKESPFHQQIVLPEGISYSTVELLEGTALPKREPQIVKIEGTLDAPLKWLEKRADTINEKECHIIVDREKMSIALHIDETNYFETTITGKLSFHPVFLKFGINSGVYRTPLEMAEFFKMNRSAFDNRQQAMELVSQLRGFRAKVDKQVESDHNPNKGDKRVLIAQAVDSNIPPSFKLHIPIFKGEQPVTLEVETYFNADDLTCTLVSPMANDFTEDTKNTSIDEILDKIVEIAKDIAIINV